MKEFIVGEVYPYSSIPEQDTEEFTVSQYGIDYIGQYAIHIRYFKEEVDVWFIWHSQGNQAYFKCVYNY